MGKRNHTTVLILLDTGVRVSELVNLQMNNLYLEQGYFKVFGKGSKERIVPLGRCVESSRGHLNELTDLCYASFGKHFWEERK